jgi:heme exporter protein A
VSEAAPPPGGTPVLEAEHLLKMYGAFPALNGLTLRIMPGESILLLGPNGAGKSTFLRTVATRLRPSSGVLRLFGADPANADRRDLRRRIGHLAHQTGLYDHLTVEENLLFFARLHGLDSPADLVRRGLLAVGLQDRRTEFVRALSRGLQQRLAIARVLLHRPELLLLDEPFTGLDQHAAARLREILQENPGEARTCLLASHDLAAAWPLATRLVILAGGRVALDQPAAGIDAGDLDALYRDTVGETLRRAPRAAS